MGDGARGVLITRPEPDATETAARVAARGLLPVVAPVLTLRTRTLSPRGGFDAVLVTSRNAVGALPPRLHAVRLLAVGSATAARARAAGFAEVQDAAGDAAALAALVRASVAPGARLLFAHGAGQGDALAAELRAEGYVLTRRVAYAVTAARRLPEAACGALQAGTLRSAMFLSAETARAFVRLLPLRLRATVHAVDAVAIADRAAAALAPLPWRRVRVSTRPTLDEVLALL